MKKNINHKQLGAIYSRKANFNDDFKSIRGLMIYKKGFKNKSDAKSFYNYLQEDIIISYEQSLEDIVKKNSHKDEIANILEKYFAFMNNIFLNQLEILKIKIEVDEIDSNNLSKQLNVNWYGGETNKPEYSVEYIDTLKAKKNEKLQNLYEQSIYSKKTINFSKETLEDYSNFLSIFSELTTSKIVKKNITSNKILQIDKTLLLEISNPNFLDSNIVACKISDKNYFETTEIYFFPTFILAFNSHKDYAEGDVQIIPFREIKTEEKVIEIYDTNPSKKSNIKSQTWEYVNKDGSPDLRHNSNHQIFLVDYYQLDILHNDFQFSLLTSDLINGENLNKIIKKIGESI